MHEQVLKLPGNSDAVAEVEGELYEALVEEHRHEVASPVVTVPVIQ